MTDPATRADKARALLLAVLALGIVMTLLVAFCLTGPHHG